jgi:hypothetical protein
LPAFCAVPAGGAGIVAGAVLVEAFWAGGLAGACAAAAGVSQAAAKAIAHPIRLIFTPGMRWVSSARLRAPDLRASIGAAFESLKRPFGDGIQQVLKPSARRPNGRC